MKTGWETKPLEQCLQRVKYINKIPRKHFKKSGQYPIVSQEKDKINGFWDKKEDILSIDKPVIIFGDHTKTIKYIDFDFAIGADGVKILKTKEFINPKYFYYFLQSDPVDDMGYARHYRLLKQKQVSYPRSISEQRAIVEKLDAVLGAAERAQAVARAARDEAAALFSSALHAHLSHPGPDWRDVRLGDVCKIRPPKKEAHTKIGAKDLVSFVPMESLGILQSELLPHTQRPLEEVYKSYTYFSEGDILLAKITPCFENGKIGIASNLCNGIGFGSSEFIVIRPGRNLDKDYLFYFLSREEVRAKGKKVMSGACGHKRVPNDFIEHMPMLLPPLPEQRAIVEKLDALRDKTRALEGVYTQKLDALAALRHSVLHHAFRGEL
jgi:type I restriction enzyme, S subunit